ncbi:MAG: 23S rRNA (adenine(2503)-C(2))-methyltransferase RlmN [Bacteroidales bacterium]|nr:23S rRNA (adenine(2503)-C(2))-methyltransferase RlmN [Bacteroidales bacterium]
MNKDYLFGKSLNSLISITKEFGLPGFTAHQIADWLYKKRVSSIDEMTNLSKKARTLLNEKYELGLFPPLKESISVDGTKKYLFKVLDNKYIETAYIPEKERATICLSTQVGCKMGCRFCMTGRQGFQGNLSSNGILNQFRSIPDSEKLTNIVFMGMGEPLDNIDAVLESLDILTSEWGYGWSPTRITVSTVGLKKNIKRFLTESKCHLAISLHSPFDKEREELMPIQKSNKIADILDIIENYDFSGQRRVSFEYILLKGINDTPAHVKELARILNKIKCRINIIRFHNIPGSPFVSPDIFSTNKFRDMLNDKGIIATVRTSRGEDISAACGLLSTLEQNR